MAEFYVLNLTTLGPEVTEVQYKHNECRSCGTRPIARVGSTCVKFSRKSDLLDFSRTANGILVRQQVLDVFYKTKVSGWRSGDVGLKFVSRLKVNAPSYRELVIVGHTINYQKNVGLSVKRQCPKCGITAYERPKTGLMMPIESWDYSDIFCITELPGIYMVTKYFHEIVTKYQYTGLELIELEEWYSPI